MLQAGRWIGLLASGGTMSLWVVFLIANPYPRQGIKVGTYAVVAAMLVLGLVAIVAVLKTKPYLMLLVFGLSFFPVGLYMSGMEGVIKWVGVFNVLFLPSSLLMLGISIRSILAVIGGYLIMAGCIGAVNGLIMTLFPRMVGGGSSPTLAYLIVNLASGAGFAILGGYVTALLAKRSEIKHALGLGGLALFLGVVSLIMYYGRQPLWYQIALLVIVLPSVLLGGILRADRVKAVEGSGI